MSIKSHDTNKTPTNQPAERSKLDIGESWKDIIFLPFNRLVMFTFIGVTYLSVMYNIYLLTYAPKEIHYYADLVLGTVCEVIYFLCVVVIALHRFMKVHRQRMIYKPNPLILFVADIVSILPLGSLYSTINRYTWNKYFSEYQVNFNQCYLKFVRIVRLIFFYFDLRSNLTNNQTAIIITCHLFGSFLVIFILGSIFISIQESATFHHNLSWWDKWLDSNSSFDKNNHFNRFIICTYEIAGLYFNNSAKYLIYNNVHEAIVICVAMFLGFISQYTFLLGALTSEELQGMRARYNLQLRLNAAKKLMSTLIMPPLLQKTVCDYYETIWNYRYGVVTMPMIIQKLPPFMQSEVLTDIYWEALLHTKIFVNVSNVFQKMIAQQMKTEIYMQGHLIFRAKDVKAKLVYIKSGKVEVSTAEDSIILTSGSVICEVSCIQISECSANVKCLTNCTLHVLYMVDFYSVLLKNYRNEFKTLRITYANRIEYAKKKLKIVGKKIKMSHMRWVKTQWINIFKREHVTHDHNFTSRFLDLIAMLPSEVDPNAFCLRGDCPFVMVADTSLFHLFYYLTLIATLLNFFITFDDIFITGKLQLENYKYYILIDTIFLWDIYVQCITTVKTFHGVIDQPYEIVLYQMKNICFLIDLLATLPIDYAFLFIGSSPRMLGMIRTNRYFRLYKLIIFFHNQEKRITSYSTLVKLLKFILYHILLGLILTCCVYICNCSESKCHLEGFLELTKRTHQIETGKTVPVSNFLICFYYTINICMKLIYTVFYSFYLPDIAMKIIIVVIGYYVLTIELSQYCATVGLKFERQHLLQEYVEKIDIYVQENKELKKYKNRLYECLSAEWSISGDLRFADLCSVTNQESEFLRRVVNDEYILFILEQTEFFKQFPRDFLLHLAHRSRIFLIPEGHELVKFNNKSLYLYIVVQGYCIGKSLTAGDWEKNIDAFYKRLDMFPLLEFLHQVKSLMEVKSHTAVQVITIPYSVFQASISVYDKEMKILNEALKAQMQQFWGMLKRSTVTAFMNRDPNTAKNEEKNKPVMFQYQIRRQNLILDITNCSQQKSRDSAFLTYRKTLKLVLLSTYSPTSKWYIAYEMFRCLCILVEVNITYFLCVAAIYRDYWIHIVFCTLHVLGFCDLLIKAHLEYYNEYGILVRGLKSTTLHYLHYSFAIDLIAILPYEWFHLSVFVHRNFRESSEIIFLISTKMLLLWRPWKLSTFLQGNCVTRGQTFLKYVTHILCIYFLVLHLAALKLLLTCEIDGDRNYVCPEQSWIFLQDKLNNWSNEHFYWISVQSIVGTGVTVAGMVSSYSDHVKLLLLGILIICVRIALLCKITGDNCIRQARLVQHQDALKRYNTYFRDRLVSNTTKHAMLDHYKNIWQKSYSEKSEKIFENIYPHLRETLLLTMYKKAVSKCILFQKEDIALFKLFIPYLEERYFIKDARIINVNDVQGNIFIVVKGYVEMSIAGTRLSILGPGGFFGCFEPLGLNRQTTAARALQHTNILVIEATKFYQLTKGFAKTEALMKRLRFSQFQFATVLTGSKRDATVTLHSNTETSLANKRSFALNTKYRKLYLVYMYITNVHVAPLSVFCVLLDVQLEFGVMRLLPLWVVLDLYFLLCFVLRGRVPILDSKTGLEITKKSDLRRYYFKSFLFIMDLITLIPLYLGRIWTHENLHQLVFLWNKIFRLFFLYSQYQGYVISKNIPRHIQWTLLIYYTFFLAQLIFIIWWFTIDLPFETKSSNDFLFKGYIKIMSYISTSGVAIGISLDTTHIRNNTTELLTDLMMIVLSTGLTIALATLFTKSVVSGNSYECVYRYRAKFCKQFCKVCDVSEALVTRIWYYLHFLYKKQGGEQFPKLYLTAPRYLKQEHMQSLYGKHFNEHPLFYDLHVDLIRQIQMYIKCYYFTPGSIIVEKGSKNEDFFFIDCGNVVAMQETRDDDPNLTYEILGPGNTFGEVQAFLNLEHNKTYQALTSVDMITITVSDWVYLLDWFPASKQKLIGRLNERAELFNLT